MSKSEMLWYYILLGLTSFLGITFIQAFVKTESLVPYIVFGIVLGVGWSSIWKLTFAKLFEKKEDKEGNK